MRPCGSFCLPDFIVGRLPVRRMQNTPSARLAVGIRVRSCGAESGCSWCQCFRPGQGLSRVMPQSVGLLDQHAQFFDVPIAERERIAPAFVALGQLQRTFVRTGQPVLLFLCIFARNLYGRANIPGGIGDLDGHVDQAIAFLFC